MSYAAKYRRISSNLWIGPHRMRLRIAAGIFAIISCVALHSIYQTIELHNYMKYDIKCYFTSIGDDALPPIDKRFPKKSIFFIDSSCKGGLNSRQACSVESAARSHPYWQINVLFCSNVSLHNLNQNLLKTLQQYRNVKLARIFIPEYIKGSILEKVLTQDVFKKALYPINKMANALRYLTLYKWSGIYLDTDVVVAKNLEPLGPNWAARESDNYVNNAVFALSGDAIGRKMAFDLLRQYTLKYRLSRWGTTGPKLITSVLKTKWCSTDKTKNFSGLVCGGFEIHNSSLIYPFPWNFNAKKLFTSGDNLLENTDSYTYHLWNHVTNKYKHIPEDSPYGILARNFCPLIFQSYGDKFGS